MKASEFSGGGGVVEFSMSKHVSCGWEACVCVCSKVCVGGVEGCGFARLS